MSEQQAGEAGRVPGAAYPREPNIHSGGAQDPGGDRDLPPYDDRQKVGPGTDTDALLEERGGVPGHEAGPRDISKEEAGGMADTDLTPTPDNQHGVGATTTTSGEDLMRGKSEDERREERLDGGIGETTRNVDPDMPDMRTGDQGG